MEKSLIAYCGTYCGVCEWKDKTGCKGCQANAGVMFWGECDKAKCCIQKNIGHCGECENVPCQKLQALFDDPEHGDNGVRLYNLQNWKNGNYVYKSLGNIAQEQAKNLSHTKNVEMENRICQSCGMPLTSEDQLGCNKDGSINNNYCKYCYENGEFIDKVTMEEYIEMCAQYGSQAGMTNEEMKEHCTKLFPTLKRWKRG